VTKALLLVLLIVGKLAVGQIPDSLSKIIIEYGKSHNSWGDPGIYGSGERIELSSTISGNYEITRHLKITFSAGNDGKTFHQDTIQIATRRQILPKERIEFWLEQLNTNKENFTYSYIKPKMKRPSKNEIFGVARKYDIKWIFGTSDFEKESTKLAIKNLRKFSQLDSFLKFKRKTIEFVMVVTDSYNKLVIQTIRNKDTTEYQCQFFEPLGQPIFRYDHRNFNLGKKVFNLEANSSCIAILPEESAIKKVLDINNIKEAYIKWYLKN
jgi:hypothetical protein